MSAFFGISVWVTLAMIVPGLVTLATLYGAFLVATSCMDVPMLPDFELFGDWAISGIAVTVMIMTQGIGILVEGVLTRVRWYCPESRTIVIPEGIDPFGVVKFDLRPYEEYQGLYLLLAELREGEDHHGHLQRALAQFFLSSNTMVSYAAGSLATLWLIVAYGCATSLAWGYLALLLACLAVTTKVVRIRFEVMAKALWAARRRRIEDLGKDARQGA